MMPQAFHFVTVVIPVRNEGVYMRKSLQAVLEQDYPKAQMEIIIADGMSTDGTRKTIRNFQKEHPNLKMIDNPKRIVAPGLNEAIRHFLW